MLLLSLIDRDISMEGHNSNEIKSVKLSINFFDSEKSINLQLYFALKPIDLLSIEILEAIWPLNQHHNTLIAKHFMCEIKILIFD